MSREGAAHVISAVDVWSQPIDAATVKLIPEVHPLLRKSGSGYLIDAAEQGSLDVSVDDHAALVRQTRGGVGHVLMSAWVRPECSIISNDRVAEFTQAHPDLFSGLACVDLKNPVHAVRELRRAVRELGFVGLRQLPWLWSMPPDSKLFYPVLTECVELGVPFCTQVGHTGPHMSSQFGRPIPYIDDLALRFPDLRIVCGHIGEPWLNEMISCCWKHPNVYIDTSAYLPKYYPQELVQFMSSSRGKDRVMFGTNFPMLPWAKCREQVDELGLPEDVMHLFLHENAERVFKLGGGRRKSAL